MGIKKQNELRKKEGKNKYRLDRICAALQLMGWTIFILAVTYDGIASAYTLQYSEGISWWQSGMALYGLSLVWLGRRGR